MERTNIRFSIICLAIILVIIGSIIFINYEALIDGHVYKMRQQIEESSLTEYEVMDDYFSSVLKDTDERTKDKIYNRYVKEYWND